MAEKEIKTSRFELVEVTTQTAPAIKDNSTGKFHDSLSLLLVIANDIEEVKKGVLGK